jgi:protein-S-isoprenylcysteine O-methyltransferase Ste14
LLQNIHAVSESTTGPHVAVPPPFVFVGGWLIAWLLSRLRALEIDGAGASTVQSALGVALMAGGFALMAWGIVTFTRARTPVVPVRPARVVVTGGPFRFTRNPMYLGFTMMYVGLAALLNTAWPVILLPVVLLVLTSFVIEREEAHLKAAFPDDYDAYRACVRRWV